MIINYSSVQSIFFSILFQVCRAEEPATELSKLKQEMYEKTARLEAEFQSMKTAIDLINSNIQQTSK